MIVRMFKSSEKHAISDYILIRFTISGTISTGRDHLHKDEEDETSSDAWKKLHVGGYSRKICETRANIIDGIVCLCDDLKECIAGMDDSRTKYSTKCLKRHDKDDILEETKDMVVFRKLHIDKFMF